MSTSVEHEQKVLKVFAVKVNNAESGSPYWKWYAATTRELLLVRTGSLQTLGLVEQREIFYVEGVWRTIEKEIEKPVSFFE